MNNTRDYAQPKVYKCTDHTDCGRSHTACQSAKHWIYALNKVRHSIYNSTSTALPSPGRLMTVYDEKLKRNSTTMMHTLITTYSTPVCDDLDQGLFDFNADPLSTQDMFTYRIARSEHILVRIYHHHYDDSPKQNILRLSKGIFIKQQIDPPPPRPRSFPSSCSCQPLVEELVNMVLLSNNHQYHYHQYHHDSELNHINTFDFNHINYMIQQEPTIGKFIPYTYTLGARYTNPYRNYDILVRGNIPLWCQTLLIHNCLQETIPIQPGSTRSGLLPFAPNVQFEFKTCYGQEPPLPILTLLFERLSMELSEPEFIMEDKLVIKGTSWVDKQASILSGILYCDIPNSVAEVVTNLAQHWASTQGISPPTL